MLFLEKRFIKYQWLGIHRSFAEQVRDIADRFVSRYKLGGKEQIIQFPEENDDFVATGSLPNIIGLYLINKYQKKGVYFHDNTIHAVRRTHHWSPANEDMAVFAGNKLFVTRNEKKFSAMNRLSWTYEYVLHTEYLHNLKRNN